MNAIFVAGMLGTIGAWFMAAVDSDATSSAGYAVAYLFLVSFFVAGALVLVLLVHAVAARTIALLKWPFVLFVLTYLVLFRASAIVIPRLTGSDTVQLRVMNESGGVIDRVNVFGRGESVSIDSFPDDSDVVVPYRGRELNFRTRDEYSNRVYVRWYARDRWRERVLVGAWTGISDSLAIVFPTPDSVRFAERRAVVIPK